MTVLRATARTLLASYFVSSGVKALRHPAPLVPAAEPIAAKLVPLVKRYAPAQVATFVPEDTASLVRVNGALQLAGGLALATGKGRRLGALLLAASLVPSTLGKYPFWSESDPELKAASRTHFAKNLSLLGGVLLAAGDTEGRPSLAYRAQKTGAALARDTKRAARRANKRIEKATSPSSPLSKTAHDVGETVADAAGDFSHKVGDLSDGLLAGGAALLAAAATSTRKSRKQAAKQLKRTRRDAGKQFAQLQKTAGKQARVGGKAAREQFDAAKKEGLKRLEAAQKEAGQQVKAARKQARKVGRHIHLGEN